MSRVTRIARSLALVGIASFLWTLGCKQDPAPGILPAKKGEVKQVAPEAPRPSPAPAPSPEEKRPAAPVSESKYAFQVERWNRAQIKSINAVALDKAAGRFSRDKSRYQTISDATGVPSVVVFVLHYRESSNSFTRHLHNGDPLSGRTVQVPAGRPVKGNPPFSFEESAIDALVYDSLDRVAWESLGEGLQALEKYNGLGYQEKGRVSPYLWSGTDLYSSGKYVRDGVYDPSAIDRQLGVATIIKWMVERGIGVWPVVTIKTTFLGEPSIVVIVQAHADF